MASGIPRSVVETIRSAPLPEDLDRIVEEQLRDVKIAGRTYAFRPETKCRVCRNEELRSRVEDLLAAGTTYMEILAIIRPSNELRAERDQITYHSVRKHATECFEISRAGQMVYREIMERRATEHNVDFVKGTSHAVTLFAVLETVMVKGYAAITDERIPITPELAISAGKLLHELTSQDNGAAQAAEMIAKVSRLQEVIFSVCTPEQIAEIEQRLDPKSDAIDADWDDDQDDDDDDDEDFDPETDADGGYERDPDDLNA